MPQLAFAFYVRPCRTRWRWGAIDTHTACVWRAANSRTVPLHARRVRGACVRFAALDTRTTCASVDDYTQRTQPIRRNAHSLPNASTSCRHVRVFGYRATHTCTHINCVSAAESVAGFGAAYSLGVHYNFARTAAILTTNTHNPNTHSNTANWVAVMRRRRAHPPFALTFTSEAEACASERHATSLSCASHSSLRLMFACTAAALTTRPPRTLPDVVGVLAALFRRCVGVAGTSSLLV